MTIISHFSNAIIDGLRLQIPQNCPPSLATLMGRSWHSNPELRPSFSEIVFRLDESYIEISISNKIARNFWANNFLIPCYSSDEMYTTTDDFQGIDNPISIHFKDFLKVCKFNKLNAEYVENLRDLFCEKILGFDIITVEQFERLTQCFGEFFNPQNPEILKMMVRLFQNPWFHGFIDGKEAEARLHGRIDGTWLLRMRSRNFGHIRSEYSFCISFTKSGKIFHTFIEHDPFIANSGYFIVLKHKKRIEDLEHIPLKFKKIFSNFHVKRQSNRLIQKIQLISL